MELSAPIRRIDSLEQNIDFARPLSMSMSKSKSKKSFFSVIGSLFKGKGKRKSYAK